MKQLALKIKLLDKKKTKSLKWQSKLVKRWSLLSKSMQLNFWLAALIHTWGKMGRSVDNLCNSSEQFICCII